MNEYNTNCFVIAAVCIAALSLTIPFASASVFVYGSVHNYSVNVLPNGSYVHQGENISMGQCYDLGGVYGFTGKFGWWKDSENAGMGYPDKIVDLGDLKPHHLTCIDDQFVPGEWYQWDGYNCEKDSFCTSGFGRGNSYVFAVVARPVNMTNQTVITYKNITRTNMDGTFEVVQVTVVETIRVPDNRPDVPPMNVTTIVLPTTSPTPTPVPTLMTPVQVTAKAPEAVVVTPPAPLSPLIGIIAIIGGVIWLRRR
jgi:hypothetical protein